MAYMIGILAAVTLLAVGVAFGRDIERFVARREAERDVQALQALERIHFFTH